MSRSYRRPYGVQAGPKRRKKMKTEFNKSLRHEEEMPSGNTYRKMRETWDIDDFGKSYQPNDPKLRRK